MNKPFLFGTFLFVFSSFAFAQALDFTFATPQPDLVEIYGGNIANGDIDGDGDVDILMTGISPRRETNLYLNDGAGNFTEVGNLPFPRARGDVAQFKDLDGDGDLDLFLAGSGFSVQEFCGVYLNDGQGVFTEVANPNLPKFADRGADLADVDGDGDIDVLIAVKAKGDVFMADVFLNDGNAVFSPSGSTIFTPVEFGRVKFLDVDNDDDVDAIISGEDENESVSATLYLNDGTGNFSVSTTSGLVPFGASDIDAADVDDDGDLDVLMSGADNTVGGSRTILYLNDGDGQFTELATANLQQVSGGSGEMEDFDNDGDQDLVIIGTQAGGLPNIYVIVYENKGDNVFIPVDTLGGEYIANSVADDFNGDGLTDLIIIGFVDDTSVWWNTSSNTTSVSTSAPSLPVDIFPNPSNGQLTITLEEEIPGLSLAIYSTEGRLMYEQPRVFSRTTNLELDLAAGAYFIRLRSGASVATRKLLIVD